MNTCVVNATYGQYIHVKWPTARSFKEFGLTSATGAHISFDVQNAAGPDVRGAHLGLLVDWDYWMAVLSSLSMDGQRRWVSS